MGAVCTLIMAAICLIGGLIYWGLSFVIHDPLTRFATLIFIICIVTAAISFFTDK